MTLQEELKKIDGTVTRIGVRIGGGYTAEVDGAWKKYSGEWEMEAIVNPDQDPVEAAEVLQATCQAFMSKYFKPIESHYASMVAKPLSKQEQIQQAPLKDLTPDMPAQEPAEMKCSIHGVMMRRRENEKGSWYSHPIEGEKGKWCSGK